MKNLKVNKSKIVSLLLAGSIALSMTGCGSFIKNKKNNEDIMLSDTITVSYEENEELHHDLTEVRGYMPIALNGVAMVQGDNFTLHAGDRIYFDNGTEVTYKDVVAEELPVKLTLSNRVHALVTLPDGEEGYVSVNSLQAPYDMLRGNYQEITENKERAIKYNTYLYDQNGKVIDYLYQFDECMVEAENGLYSLIKFEDGKNGFVPSNLLLKDFKKIMGMAALDYQSNIYLDEGLTQIAYKASDHLDHYVNIEYIHGDAAAIYDRKGNRLLFVHKKDIVDHFIVVFANDMQELRAYLDYQLARECKIRTGSDAKPTYGGYFRIYEKATNFTFDNNHGHADYVLKYSTTPPQWIHNLTGDDEGNYGTQAYHNPAVGSNGCDRTKFKDAEWLYNNYYVGDIVIVFDNNDMTCSYDNINNELVYTYKR